MYFHKSIKTVITLTIILSYEDNRGYSIVEKKTFYREHMLTLKGKSTGFQANLVTKYLVFRCSIF